jgi:hypothetical protein
VNIPEIAAKDRKERKKMPRMDANEPEEKSHAKPQSRKGEEGRNRDGKVNLVELPRFARHGAFERVFNRIECEKGR